MRITLSCVFAVGIVFLLGCPVWAEPDLLMRTVGFALTGSNDADLRVIGDRTGCVFAIKNEVFRLNNVYADRIKIRRLQRQWLGVLEQRVTVELHGDDIIFEETVEPPKDDGSELTRQMRVHGPSMFEPHHYSYTQHELYLGTNDEDRVKAAWNIFTAMDAPASEPLRMGSPRPQSLCFGRSLPYGFRRGSSQLPTSREIDQFCGICPD